MPERERVFTDAPAVLRRVSLRLALAGPTGSGKSLSAHLLAHGLSRVDGKPVYLINTEGPSKGLFYAPRPGKQPEPPKSFPFVEVPLVAPYGSLDYLAAMQHCEKRGAGTIIVDQGSFEHEGEGGYLDLHERELDRMVGKDADAKVRAKYWAAWVRPGAERHRMLMGMDQLSAHIIWCFRAKEKLKIIKGQNPIDLGWQAIAGLEVLSEFPVRLLLPEGADGVPNLDPEMPGEKLFNRVPIHLRDGFFRKGEAIGVGLGERLARWAAGDAAQGSSPGADRQPQGQPERTAGGPDERQALLDQVAGLLAHHCTTKEQREGALQAAFGTFTKAGIGRLNVYELKAGADALKTQLEGLDALRNAGPPEREPGMEG